MGEEARKGNVTRLNLLLMLWESPCVGQEKHSMTLLISNPFLIKSSVVPCPKGRGKTLWFLPLHLMFFAKDSCAASALDCFLRRILVQLVLLIAFFPCLAGITLFAVVVLFSFLGSQPYVKSRAMYVSVHFFLSFRRF